MSSCNVESSASSHRHAADAGDVSTDPDGVNVSSGRSSGILERKLTDHVNKQLMAAHLRLDLKQVEKPEVGRIYQEVVAATMSD